LASFQEKSNMFGFLLQGTSFVEGTRSLFTSEAVFYDPDGNILGYGHLSDGPDYGYSILLSVVKGWGIASLIALVVSIAIGWKSRMTEFQGNKKVFCLVVFTGGEMQ
jgi:hypothetical protein